MSPLQTLEGIASETGENSEDSGDQRQVEPGPPALFDFTVERLYPAVPEQDGAGPRFGGVTGSDPVPTGQGQG